MWKTLSSKTQKGLTLMEIVLVVTVIAILATAGYQVYSTSLQMVERARQYTLAELMAHDLVELTISKRNEDWNSLATGNWHFTETATGVSFVSGSEVVGTFTRYVQISAVNRNSSGVIVTSGGTTDPDTFKADAFVNWTYKGKSHQVKLTQYLTNWRKF